MRTIASAFFILLCSSPLPGRDIDAPKAVAFLKSLQTSEGAFTPSKSKLRLPTYPTIGSTSAAVRALKYLGEDVPNKEACVRFLDSCFDAQVGAFRMTPQGQAEVSATAVGLMAVMQLKLPLDKYAAAADYLESESKDFEAIRIAAAGFEALHRKPAHAKEWVEFVRKTSNAKGMFGPDDGRARDTASAVVTLLRLQADPPASSKAILALLDAQQETSGGWRKDSKAQAADLETTYRVMRCYHMLKARPKGEAALKDFLAKCQNADGGFGPSPGEESSASGTYFAAVIKHWLKD